jgi:hypothetical protein
MDLSLLLGKGGYYHEVRKTEDANEKHFRLNCAKG